MQSVLLSQAVVAALLICRYLFVVPVTLTDKALRAILFRFALPSSHPNRCREFSPLAGATSVSSVSPASAGGAPATAAARMSSFLAQREAAWAKTWHEELPLPVCMAVAAYFVCIRLPLIGGFLERACIMGFSGLSYFDALASASPAAVPAVSPTAQPASVEPPSESTASNEVVAARVVRCNRNYGLLFFDGTHTAVEPLQSDSSSYSPLARQSSSNNIIKQQQSSDRVDEASSGVQQQQQQQHYSLLQGEADKSNESGTATRSGDRESRSTPPRFSCAATATAADVSGRRAASSSASPDISAASPELFANRSTSSTCAEHCATPNEGSLEVGQEHQQHERQNEAESASQERLSREGTAQPEVESSPLIASEDFEPQNQEQDTKNNNKKAKHVVIWVDATAARSAIPLWSSKLWQPKSSNFSGGDQEGTIVHCQLVALREADAPDAAGLVCPATPYSPAPLLVDSRAFPSTPNNNTVRTQSSVSAPESHQNHKIGDQSSRVLTEALAEGIASAWGLAANSSSSSSAQNNNNNSNGLMNESSTLFNESCSSSQQLLLLNSSVVDRRVSFACFGYEAAAAVLLAATSSGDRMKAALDSIIFFDSLTLGSKCNAGVEADFSSLSSSRDRGLLEELWRAIAVPIEVLEEKRATAATTTTAVATTSIGVTSLASSSSSAPAATAATSASASVPKPALKRRGSMDAGAGSARKKPMFRVPSTNDWSHLLDQHPIGGGSRSTTPIAGATSPPVSPASSASRGRPHNHNHHDDTSRGDGEAIASTHAINAASGNAFWRSSDSVADLAGDVGEDDDDDCCLPLENAGAHRKKTRFEFGAKTAHSHTTDDLFRNDMRNVAARVNKALSGTSVKFVWAASPHTTDTKLAVLSQLPQRGDLHHSPSSQFLVAWFNLQVRKSSRSSPFHGHRAPTVLLLELGCARHGVARPLPMDISLLFSSMVWNKTDTFLVVRCARKLYETLQWAGDALTVCSGEREQAAKQKERNSSLHENTKNAINSPLVVDLVEYVTQQVFD